MLRVFCDILKVVSPTVEKGKNMGITRQAVKKKQKRRRRLKVVAFVLLFIILLIGGYVAYGFYNVYKAAKESYTPLGRDHSKYRESSVTIGKNPISILLMGVEDYSTGGKNGRTDTLILVTLNPHTHKMTMTSIPRDTRVPIAGRNGVLDKINSAYAYGSASGYGGTRATIETVENFLQVPVDYYVKIGFNGFAKAIDEIGGVTVDVPFDFWEKDIFNHNKPIYFKKGPMHLNGEQALAYVRMRKRDPRGDFGRNDRQRQVIKAAISQAVSAKTIFKVDELSHIFGKNVETNLKPSDMYALERAYANISSSNIESIRLDDKGRGETINGVWYFVPDQAGVAEVTAKIRQELGLSQITDSTTGNENAGQNWNGSVGTATNP